MRRRFTRRFAGRTRSRSRLLWIREVFNQAAPANPDNQDMLANYKAQFAITANLPGMTIMRLHLRLNVEMTQSGQGANNGAFIGCWVDSTNQAILAASARPFDQQFLIFDELYIGEALQQGGVTPFYVTRVYDIKSRRKIQNVQDTLWFQVQPNGLATVTAYSFTMSLLVMLH